MNNTTIEGIIILTYITSGILCFITQIISPPCQNAPTEFRGQAEGTGLFLCFIPILNTILMFVAIYDLFRRFKK